MLHESSPSIANMLMLKLDSRPTFPTSTTYTRIVRHSATSGSVSYLTTGTVVSKAVLQVQRSPQIQTRRSGREWHENEIFAMSKSRSQNSSISVNMKSNWVSDHPVLHTSTQQVPWQR